MFKHVYHTTMIRGNDYFSAAIECHIFYKAMSKVYYVRRRHLVPGVRNVCGLQVRVAYVCLDHLGRTSTTTTGYHD